MQSFRRLSRPVASLLSLLLITCTLWASPASAAVVSTGELLSEQRADVDRAALLGMLDRQDVQATLSSMGVSEQEVRDRVQSLTPSELASFNEQLAEAPAGEGVVGIIVLFLLVFIVTDMLCATDIFPFVNCIR